MRTLVRSLHDKTHMTTVMVTHDRQEALSMSDRLALMLKGEIIQCGSPQELLNKPASPAVSDYFGDDVYLSGKVENGLFSCNGISCPVNVPDGEYSLILKPTK